MKNRKLPSLWLTPLYAVWLCWGPEQIVPEYILRWERESKSKSVLSRECVTPLSNISKGSFQFLDKTRAPELPMQNTRSKFVLLYTDRGSRTAENFQKLNTCIFCIGQNFPKMFKNVLKMFTEFSNSQNLKINVSKN